MRQKLSIDLWFSKLSLDLLGDQARAFESKVRGELDEIASEASAWFMHMVESDDGQASYLCEGTEHEASWRVLVRKAHFEHLTTLPEDHPDPKRRGSSVSFPKADELPSNDEFVQIGRTN